VKFETVNRAALAVLPTVLTRLIPGGKILGHEYVALKPTRNDRRPGSFKINVRTGRWSDFATGDRGGDPVSLVAYLKNVPPAPGSPASRPECSLLMRRSAVEDKFAPIDSDELAAAGAHQKGSAWTPIVPVPDGRKLPRSLLVRCCPPGHSLLALEAGARSVRIVAVPGRFDQKWDLVKPAPEGAICGHCSTAHTFQGRGWGRLER
jgi:hypothetical protein